MILKFLLKTSMIQMIFMEIIDNYNPSKKHKILIILDMILSLVFIAQSYFGAHTIILIQNIRINSKHYFIMNTPNKRSDKLQLIIHQILTLKRFYESLQYVLPSHILS